MNGRRRLWVPKPRKRTFTVTGGGLGGLKAAKLVGKSKTAEEKVRFGFGIWGFGHGIECARDSEETKGFLFGMRVPWRRRSKCTLFIISNEINKINNVCVYIYINCIKRLITWLGDIHVYNTRGVGGLHTCWHVHQ